MVFFKKAPMALPSGGRNPGKNSIPEATQQYNYSNALPKVNEARALRVTEIMTDYQGLLRRIAEYAPNPPPEDYYEQGYEVLRQCRAEARAVLVVPYPVDLSHMPNGSEEQEKSHLQRIIVDASARRFQAKKIYLRAVAAVRWSNARSALLQAGTPQAAQLQQELAAITDTRIIDDFRQADTQAGYWLQDDPPLATILNWIRSQPT
ncbi:MAG: hypothetical protein Q9181_006105 [Wetmoreana brouardii]